MPHIHQARISNVRKNPLRVDPTRTGLIRRRFQAEIVRRVKALKRDVWDFLVIKDALGIRQAQGTAQTPAQRLYTISGVKIGSRPADASNPTILAAPQPREYQFRTDAGKLKAFRDWLQEQMQAGLLAPVEGTDPNKPWTYKYIESAYRKGLTSAYISSKMEGALADETFFNKSKEQFLSSSFNSPETLSKVELLATRSFEELNGVSSAMAQNMNRILAQGLADGRGAVDIAREMSKKIDGISRTRALVIARTEIINAHAEGQLDSFQELGIESLSVNVEWSTAGDDRVCPECASMEGKLFTIDEARGLIPAHPNCRCAWIPGPVNTKKKKGK